MREIIRGTQFKRDVKLAVKWGKEVEKFRDLILLFADEKALPARYKDQSAEWRLEGSSRCHIGPDWLLIYKVDGRDLYLVRTRTHAHLF